MEDTELLDTEQGSGVIKIAKDLAPGLTRMCLHPKQSKFWLSTKRFNIVPGGRRTGKTAIAKRKIVKAAINERRRNPWFVCGAPTHAQAKRIFWRDLRDMVPAWAVGPRGINESDLSITLFNSARISVLSMDVPSRAEGDFLCGIVLDEYGDMPEETWSAHVRPALADSQGWAILTGVPEGRNHYFDLFKEAGNKEQDWDRHHWTTEEILPLYLGPEVAAKEIESAKADMDELTYQQEYKADFVTFQGRAYYSFNELNVAKNLPYNKHDDLIFCFDFNVSPGVAAVIQEYDYLMADGMCLRSCVIGEVHIPDNSNTQVVCRKLIQDWGSHEGYVYLYGDATGGLRGSAKLMGSDWDIIKQELKPTFGDRLKFRVPKGNPFERQRLNATNSRICTMKGQRKLIVDGAKAPYVVKDFEGVRILEGSAGEIDKKIDPKLTHVSDAIGYYVHYKYPLAGHSTSSIAA